MSLTQNDVCEGRHVCGFKTSGAGSQSNGFLTRASPATQRRGVAASPLPGHGCVAREDILSNRSRGIVPRRFFCIVPNPKAVLSCCKEGGRPKTARLRSWPPERRSGCTSAEPYPPSGSGVFWPCDGVECNCLPCQSFVSPSLFRFVIAFSEDHISSIASSSPYCRVLTGSFSRVICLFTTKES